MDEKSLEKLEYHKIIDQLQTHCATSMGRHFALTIRPLAQLEEVRRRLTGTDEAYAVERLKGSVPFGGISDISTSLKRSSLGGILNTVELIAVAYNISGGRRVKRFIEAYQEKHVSQIIGPLVQEISDPRGLEQSIRHCIDDNHNILDRASDDLMRIRREIRAGEHRVRERLESIIRSSSYQKMLQDNLITMRGDRYVIPVKLEYRAAFGGIVHDQSSSGATLFIEPEQVVELNNKLREQQFQEEKEMERILQKLSGLVAEEAEHLENDAELLGQIDFLFAKAKLARRMKASIPAINDQGYLRLKRARHPLLPIEGAVPLTIELGSTYSVIVITGPNTGGKTVTLKTIGLFSLMAMTGLFIPAEDGSELCIFDAVFADIGDEQSIEQNLSTFSSHMTNIIDIMKKMTPHSLVLLDEVGAGTDPAEGSALAIAILEHIRATGCRLVATTHYSELKAYAYDCAGVVNASMEFDVDSLKPTYRLLLGIPGRSNAFAIAQRLGLPKHVIEQARVQVTEDDQKIESMIAKMEEQRTIAQSEREEAEHLRRESEQLRRELMEEKQKFQEQRQKMISQAEREASDTIRKAKKTADEIISELRRHALEESASIKEHKFTEAKRRLDAAAPQTTHFSISPIERLQPHQATPGEEVRVISLQQKGSILEVQGDDVLVQLGLMKMKIKMNDLQLVKNYSSIKPKSQQNSGPSVKRTRDENVRLELDLRGSTIEEAMIDVDQFLDEAVMNHLGQVTIIHGKGTGALRSGIHDFLRRHKLIKEFRLGSYHEGGSGVTVVIFK
jgi:DNA mismatch repair protein MutS2